MKIHIERFKAYFTELSQAERAWLEKKLIQRNKQGAVQKSLLFVEDSVHVYTLAGIVKFLKDHCPHKIEVTGEFKIEPLGEKPNIPADILSGINLEDFQRSAVAKAIQSTMGLTISPTGSGKTEIILAICRYLLDNDLAKQITIVVDAEVLARQFYQRGLKRGFSDDEISAYFGGQTFKPTSIVVSVIDSLVNSKKANGPLWNHVSKSECVICDEAHHLRASTYIDLILSFTNPRFLLGFSGSPFLENELSFDNDVGDLIVYGIAGGKIITHVPYVYLYKIGFLPTPIVHFRVLNEKLSTYRGPPQQVYTTHIVENIQRNNEIIQHASKFAKLGHQVLIMVQRLNHAHELVYGLRDFKVQGIFGGSKGIRVDKSGMIEEYTVNYDVFRESFEEKKIQIAIVSSVGDEGLDLPDVGVVILAGAGKSRIKITQRSGRGMRRKKVGRNVVYILDFWDRSHIYLLNQAKKRFELFQKMGAELVPDHAKFLQHAIDHAKELNKLKEDDQ